MSYEGEDMTCASTEQRERERDNSQSYCLDKDINTNISQKNVIFNG